VRGLIRRGLRLEFVAAMGIALAVPAMGLAAENGQQISTQVSTQTRLAVELHDQAGRTTANLTAAVVGEDGEPVTGAVVVTDHGRELAGAALNPQGQATFSIQLAAGDHSLGASYVGDPTHRASVAPVASAQGQTSTTPDFTISIAPASLSLVPGQSGTIVASITPENSSSLTAPMFVTLSCSGLPDQSSCAFTPENIEIQPNATAAITSSWARWTGMVPAPAAMAATAFAAGAGWAGYLAWGVVLQRALQLLQPRSAAESGNAGRDLHRERDSPVEQRRHGDYPFNDAGVYG